MSGSHNSSTNRSASNLPDDSGRSSATSFSVQSGSPPPVCHHTGSTQGLHNIHGNFNVANRPIIFGTFNGADIPASGVQQPSGNLSSAVAGAGLPMRGLDSRLNLTNNSGPGNLNVKGLNRLMGGVHQQGSTQGIHNIHGNFNVANGPITFGSFNVANIPASGVQQPSGNLSSGRFASNSINIPPSQISHGSSHGLSRVTNKGGMNVVGSPGLSSENWGGSVPSHNQSAVPGGGLSMPGLDSRLNLTNNSGPGGPNRLMGGVYQQASPAVSSMLENSYHGAGTLSQNHGQSVNNPLLNSRPSSVGGPQGQVVHDNTVTTMQPQQFSVGRCGGFNNFGGSFSSHHPQQQQQLVQPVSRSGFPSSSGNNQNMHGSKYFPYPSYHPQTSGAPVFGSRPLNSPNIDSYDNLFQQHREGQSPYQYLLGSLPQPNFADLEPHTLFYIFHRSRDTAHLYAASNELHNKGWLFHREHQLWFKLLPDTKPLVKTSTYEIGSYTCFDPNTWKTFQKDNYFVRYKYLVRTPAPPPPPPPQQ